MTDIIKSFSDVPFRLKDMGDGTYAVVVEAVVGESTGLTDAQLRASPVPVSLADVNWSTTYAYNASNQITSETRTDGSTTQTRTYSYDANGNLTGIGAWV